MKLLPQIFPRFLVISFLSFASIQALSVWDDTRTAESFINAFNRAMDRSGVLSGSQMEDISSISDTIISAIERNPKNSKSKLQALNMAFASSVSEIAFSESKGFPNDMKIQTILDGLREAFTQTIGVVDQTFLNEIGSLVRMFSQVSTNEVSGGDLSGASISSVARGAASASSVGVTSGYNTDMSRAQVSGLGSSRSSKDLPFFQSQQRAPFTDIGISASESSYEAAGGYGQQITGGSVTGYNGPKTEARGFTSISGFTANVGGGQSGYGQNKLGQEGVESTTTSSTLSSQVLYDGGEYIQGGLDGQYTTLTADQTGQDSGGRISLDKVSRASVASSSSGQEGYGGGLSAARSAWGAGQRLDSDISSGLASVSTGTVAGNAFADSLAPSLLSSGDFVSAFNTLSSDEVINKAVNVAQRMGKQMGLDLNSLKSLLNSVRNSASSAARSGADASAYASAIANALGSALSQTGSISEYSAAEAADQVASTITTTVTTTTTTTTEEEDYTETLISEAGPDSASGYRPGKSLSDYGSGLDQGVGDGLISGATGRYMGDIALDQGIGSLSTGGDSIRQGIYDSQGLRKQSLEEASSALQGSYGDFGGEGIGSTVSQVSGEADQIGYGEGLNSQSLSTASGQLGYDISGLGTQSAASVAEDLTADTSNQGRYTGLGKQMDGSMTSSTTGITGQEGIYQSALGPVGANTYETGGYVADSYGQGGQSDKIDYVGTSNQDMGSGLTISGGSFDQGVYTQGEVGGNLPNSVASVAESQGNVDRGTVAKSRQDATSGETSILNGRIGQGPVILTGTGAPATATGSAAGDNFANSLTPSLLSSGEFVSAFNTLSSNEAVNKAVNVAQSMGQKLGLDFGALNSLLDSVRNSASSAARSGADASAYASAIANALGSALSQTGSISEYSAADTADQVASTITTTVTTTTTTTTQEQDYTQTSVSDIGTVVPNEYGPGLGLRSPVYEQGTSLSTTNENFGSASLNQGVDSVKATALEKSDYSSRGIGRQAIDQANSPSAVDRQRDYSRIGIQGFESIVTGSDGGIRQVNIPQVASGIGPGTLTSASTAGNAQGYSSRELGDQSSRSSAISMTDGQRGFNEFGRPNAGFSAPAVATAAAPGQRGLDSNSQGLNTGVSFARGETANSVINVYDQATGSGQTFPNDVASSALSSTILSATSRLSSGQANSRISSAASNLISGGIFNTSALPSVLSDLIAQVSSSSPGISSSEVLVQVLLEIVTTLIHILSSSSIGQIDYSSIGDSAATVGQTMGSVVG